METVGALFIASVGAFLLTIGIGSADCVSQCFGNGAGMQCTSCDSPQGWREPHGHLVRVDNHCSKRFHLDWSAYCPAIGANRDSGTRRVLAHPPSVVAAAFKIIQQTMAADS